MAEFTLTADETYVIKALDNIEKKLAQVGTTADATGKKIGEGLSSSEADTKRVADSLAAYTAQQEKLKASAGERIAQNAKMKAGLEQFRKEQEALNATTNEGAKANVQMTSALKDTAGGLGSAANAAKGTEAATKGATLAQRAFNFVMSLNPLGILLAALALLVNQLRKYQGVIDAASKITTQIGAVFTVVTDRAISLGKAIYSLVTLDFAGFGQNSVDAFNGLGGALSNAWTQAGNLADATVALRDAQLAAALSTAKLQAASERARDAAQDETKNFNQRVEQLKRAIGLEAEIARIKVGFAGQDLANAQKEFVLLGRNVAAKEVLLEKELAFNAAQNEASKARIQILSELNKLEKQRLDFIAKSIEDAQKLSDKLDISLIDDPTDKKLEEIRQGVLAQIEAIEEGIEKINEVEKLRTLDDSEIELRQKLNSRIAAVINQGNKLSLDAIYEGAKKEEDLSDKIEKEKREAAEKVGDDARKAFKDILELENQKIAITEAAAANFIAVLKAEGAKEEDVKKAQFEFNKNINAQKLLVELDYKRSILGFASNGTEADIISARILELQTLLSGINIPAPKGKDGRPKTIFDLLGIKFDDPEQQKAFQEAVGFIIESLGKISEARVKEAEEAADIAQKKVETAQEALDKELDIAKEGLANNVDLRKKELDEAKKARETALKEETKAKRAQIALDGAVQLSSLITTAANIFKGFSTIPILGQVLAVVSVAAMFASFAAAKAKALKAAEPPKLRKGEKVKGNTHEQGGELRELERDEQVVGAPESAGQDVFFERMRKGQYKGVDLAKLADSRSGYQSPLSDSVARTSSLQQRRDRATDQVQYNLLSKTYERVGADIVDAIKRKPSYAPWKQGYKEIKQTGHGTDTTTYQPSE